jgi:hypothetical protein
VIFLAFFKGQPMNQDSNYFPNYNRTDSIYALRQMTVALILLICLLVGPAKGQFEKSAPGGGGVGAGKVNVKVVVQYGSVEVGQKFALAVVLDVPNGWHLYANP